MVWLGLGWDSGCDCARGRGVFPFPTAEGVLYPTLSPDPQQTPLNSRAELEKVVRSVVRAVRAQRTEANVLCALSLWLHV